MGSTSGNDLHVVEVWAVWPVSAEELKEVEEDPDSQDPLWPPT